MKILLVEDDENLNKNLSFFLRKEGYQVESCANGEDALYCAQEGKPDLILLDRMLPGADGMNVLREIRAQGNHTPILMLTALGTLADRVDGLDCGADDYLVKPFAMEELMARIRSLTRRSGLVEADGSTGTAGAYGLRFGDLRLHPLLHELKGPADAVTLSGRESALLEYLMQNAGQTLSRGQLLLKVWGPEGEVEEGNLDNYIFFLRRRLRSVRSRTRITTVRGVGYRLEGGDPEDV
ncbi:MAG: response regulator transcription factor [Clostridium sp.]|nr:response regulator transcription factor [Acetatifactor muris]MCM1527659.1 response regulator transcription factor [Bacteroides sp.]MCM1563397.1 response regulator transcription factor [Clostridium sp.]